MVADRILNDERFAALDQSRDLSKEDIERLAKALSERVFDEDFFQKMAETTEEGTREGVNSLAGLSSGSGKRRRFLPSLNSPFNVLSEIPEIATRVEEIAEQLEEIRSLLKNK